MPNGPWITSPLSPSAHNPRHNPSIALAGPVLTLPLDTTALHINPDGTPPSLQLSVFDNSPNVLYNNLGTATIPLSAILSSSASTPTPQTSRVLLLDNHSGRGQGLNSTDLVLDAGGLDLTLSYQHTSTPASALNVAATRASNAAMQHLPLRHVLGIANAAYQLKELFYNLDVGKENRVSRKTLLKNISRQNSPWGRLLAELRGILLPDDAHHEEIVLPLQFNPAEEISRVFGFSTKDENDAPDDAREQHATLSNNYSTKPEYPGQHLLSDTEQWISKSRPATTSKSDWRWSKSRLPDTSVAAATTNVATITSDEEYVTWEEWLSYLETLRTVGPKNNGGIDAGVMQVRELASDRAESTLILLPGPPPPAQLNLAYTETLALACRGIFRSRGSRK